MSYRSTAASVRQSKDRHPEEFCPVGRCLWRTGGGYCPRHTIKDGGTSAPKFCPQCGHRVDDCDCAARGGS